MARRDLLEALKVAQQLVFDPERIALFSGKSLRDILEQLQRELKQAPEVDERRIVAAWRKNVVKFRTTIFESAEQAHSYVQTSQGPVLMIRENDAAKGAEKCEKGPNYPYPGD